MSDRILIYGANGYTGALVAERAVERGLRPVLAGRNGPAVAEIAARLGLEHVVADLGDAPALDAALAGRRVVIHCAGPFIHTAQPMAEACTRTGTHYLDITGEIAVFELLHAMDARAQAAGVMLLPGAGFDVVPSDCLAAHLARRLPGATHLALAFRALSRVSHGTALTAIEHLHSGGAVRRAGKIVAVPPGHTSREVDFGRGPVTVTAIPWGDVATAYYSTGIPNIEVFMAVPPAARRAMRFSGAFGTLLAVPPVRAALRALVRRRPPGPDSNERARGLSLLWGEARTPSGQRVQTRMRTPEGYTLTAHTTVLLAEKILAGQERPGFQTPSLAYGADLILELDGVIREDIEDGDHG
jgi:short subunit dehydrogenase-like uncharacterized protein